MSISDMVDGLEEIFGFVTKIGDFFSDLAGGAEDMLDGLGQEIVEAPVGVAILATDVIRTVSFGIAFIITNAICAVKSIQNFYFCFIFYIFEFLGQLAYLPIRLMLVIASFAIINVYSYERKAWEQIEKLDRFLFSFIQFHISHYPKQIRDKCYNCKRIKITSMGNILLGDIKDLSGPIPNNLFGGIGKMAKGFNRMLNAFSIF